MRLHTLAIPIPAGEAEARAMLGDQMDVVVGVAQQAFYVAVGRDAMATLKTAIDNSANAQADLPMMKMTVSLAPIMQFAASMENDETLTELAQMLQQNDGNDQVVITGRTIPRGQTSRIELQEGALQAIGVGIKFIQQQFSGGDDGF